MPDPVTEQELKDRLALIEQMLTEGRRHTESWGWTFVLWGVAYYVAIAWSAWARTPWAWPVTVVVGVIATVVGASRNSGHPETTIGRAAGSIWIALGITMCVLFPTLSLSGRLGDPHIFFAAVSAILGMANGASGLLFRWKAQLACAAVWWLGAAVTCFGSEGQSLAAFLVAIFLCQIVFGIYAMMADARERKAGHPLDA